jgi:hypothetical protein
MQTKIIIIIIIISSSSSSSSSIAEPGFQLQAKARGGLRKGMNVDEGAPLARECHLVV